MASEQMPERVTCAVTYAYWKELVERIRAGGAAGREQGICPYTSPCPQHGEAVQTETSPTPPSITLRLQTPSVPNFINVQMPPRPRQDGFDAERSLVDVGSLTHTAVEEVIAAWSEAFRANAAKRRVPQARLER